jgi:hypothetical protein
LFVDVFHTLTVFQFIFFVQGQSANSIWISPAVNWISEISLALSMPTAFLAGIPIKPPNYFPHKAAMREIFTHCAWISRTIGKVVHKTKTNENRIKETCDARPF